MDWGTLMLWGAENAAESSLSGILSVAWTVFVVIVGINALIIVHEFGHFIVARLCGVRCDKFYIWFDVAGFKFFSFKCGKTEYGLGWLPLGGYVKMFGQEDNPAAIRAEIERARQNGNDSDDKSDNQNNVDLSSLKPDSTEAEKASSDVLSTSDVQKLEETLYAPDSYLSKNVPQRMAIISAGVIMNVIFAFICAVGAYMFGVPQNPCQVGAVMPATPAWEQGLQTGDLVLEMNGKPSKSFDQITETMMDGEEVSMKIQRSGVDAPLELKVKPKNTNGLYPTIGVAPFMSTRLAAEILLMPGSSADKAAETENFWSRLKLKKGQSLKVVAVGGEPVANSAELLKKELKYIDQPIEYQFQVVDVEKDRAGKTTPFTENIIEQNSKTADSIAENSIPENNETAVNPEVEETAKTAEKAKTDESEIYRLTVEPQPMKDCGIRLAMGEICLVQPNSAAANAGLKAQKRDAEGKIIETGDIPLKINGEPIRNPLYFSYDLLKRLNGNDNQPMSLTLTVLRDKKEIDVELTLNPDAQYTGTLTGSLGTPGFPVGDHVLAAASLGFCYLVHPAVQSIDANQVQIPENVSAPIDGTVEKLEIILEKLETADKTADKTIDKSADQWGESRNLLSKERQQALFQFLSSKGQKTEKGFLLISSSAAGEKGQSSVLEWFANVIPMLPVGTPLEFTITSKDGKTNVFSTSVQGSSDGFLADRGLVYEYETSVLKADSFSEAVQLGWTKTVKATLSFFDVIKNMSKRNVSPKTMGGPIRIVNYAYIIANQGPGSFLIFLCIIGANLAVINILPIPVLDGGHLMFLCYEAVFRRPPNENILVGLSLIGLALILGLMVWVFSLDIIWLFSGK